MLIEIRRTSRRFHHIWPDIHKTIVTNKVVQKPENRLSSYGGCVSCIFLLFNILFRVLCQLQDCNHREAVYQHFHKEFCKGFTLTKFVRFTAAAVR